MLLCLTDSWLNHHIQRMKWWVSCGLQCGLILRYVLLTFGWWKLFSARIYFPTQKYIVCSLSTAQPAAADTSFSLPTFSATSTIKIYLGHLQIGNTGGREYLWGKHEDHLGCQVLVKAPGAGFLRSRNQEVLPGTTLLVQHLAGYLCTTWLWCAACNVHVSWSLVIRC